MKRIATLLLAVCGALTQPRSPAHAIDRPHVAFVLSDDLGPGDLVCFGGKLAPTPCIDGLARQGLKFTQLFVASPVCSPSRCALEIPSSVDSPLARHYNA